MRLNIQIYVLQMIHSPKKKKKKFFQNTQWLVVGICGGRGRRRERKKRSSDGFQRDLTLSRQLHGDISFLCSVSYGRVPSRTRKRITFESRTFSRQMTLGNGTPLVTGHVTRVLFTLTALKNGENSGRVSLHLYPRIPIILK